MYEVIYTLLERFEVLRMELKLEKQEPAIDARRCRALDVERWLAEMG